MRDLVKSSRSRPRSHAIHAARPKTRVPCRAKTPAGAGGELQLTDGMRLLLQKEKMYAYVYEGRRHDTGDKLGFLKATVEFALKREDLGTPFREYLKGLKL